MIRYALKCCHGHQFESWFQSADAFNTLLDRGLVACPDCGAVDVSKAMMAPRVSTQKAKTPTRAEPPINDASHPAPVSAPLSEHTQHMLKALRDHVNKHSTYVGSRFAQEARAMHLGDKPETPIHGESTPDEVRDLIEDGVPVAPLPIIPKDKAN